MMDDTTDFEIGDHVLYLLDGDVGVVTDVALPVNGGVCKEPYYVEWYIESSHNGWHSAFHSDTNAQVIVLLGGQDESR
tara:strand:- start:1182 stop:1415 length:234 start_codon:yes stop_codon:yes gene_type:complete